MGLIPDDIIDEIRNRADIVAVIGQHMQLSKAGRNFKGLCPFHNEKSPSFSVNPDKGFFYCFGCQAKGDVFSFVMEYEGKSFVETAESLAESLGIDIPEDARRDAPQSRSLKAQLLEVNKVASEFFVAQLASPAGDVARRYLSQRDITEQTSAAFHLGYAPDDWRQLIEHLEAKGVSLKLAEKVGLIVPQKSGRGFYDRFRDRLMCPIILPTGDVVGFSGRRLKEDDEKAGAKYINSPESPVYKKSKLLFGLHLAREGMRKAERAILVEGNFDVISLHQAGLRETVAPLGTALTPEQIDQLRRLTDRVILLYDGDKAGRAAALKALHAFASVDVEVRIVALPAGEDPDTMARQSGGEALAELIGRAQPALEYFIFEVWGRSTGSSHSRAKALEEAAQFAKNIVNPTKRDVIVGTLCSGLGISVEDLRRALRRSQGSERTEEVRKAPQGHKPPGHELAILAILADHPQLIKTAEELAVFSHLTDSRLRDMYCAARDGHSLLSALPDAGGNDPMAAHIAQKLLEGSYTDVKDPAETLGEMVKRLIHVRKRARLTDLQKQVEEAKRRGNQELLRQLSREILETRRQVD